MLGSGLTGLLMPVRMAEENISTDIIGIVLSMYAVGMLLGGNYSRVFIARVGHIRMFAACAAITSIAVLSCSMTMNQWVWGIMRMLMGLSIACTMAVIDGWLSEDADDKSRGRILATNQVVITLGLLCSQFLLNIASVKDATLFILAGILMCLALLPITLSKRTGPVINEMTGMTYRQLIKASPLGVACAIINGILYGAIINMLPVFAKAHSISGINLSIYMALALLGAFIMQFPVGMLSDRFDRRSILFYLLLASLFVTVPAPWYANNGWFLPLTCSTALIIGIISCLYPMSISETFDRIKRSEMASAMGGLLTLYALGYIAGPLLSSFLMKHFGNSALFSFIAIGEILLLLFVTYRMRARAPLPVEMQEPYVPQQMSVMVAPYELDPRTQQSLQEGSSSLEAKVAITMAESNPGAAVTMVKEIAQTSPEKATELTAALAQVDRIDIARLYASITRAAPELNLEIAEALASSAPERTSSLVDWIVNHQPEKLSAIITELLNSIPSSYQEELDFESEQTRLVDIEEYHQTAVELVSHFAENHPEQAVEVASAVVENIPDMASDLVEILHETEQVEEEDLVSSLEPYPHS